MAVKHKILSGDAVCSNCTAGQFSTAVGAALGHDCVLCKPGKFSLAIAATGSTTCLECERGKYALAGMGSCMTDSVRLQGMMSVSGNLTTFQRFRSKYVEGIAAVVEVHPQNVEILKVYQGSLRQLSVASISVEFQIAVEESSAQQILVLLQEDKLSAWARQNKVSVPTMNSIEATCGMDMTLSGSSRTCTACSAGTYKNATGSGVCVACPAGKFLTTEGNDADGDCVLCSKGKYSSNTSAISEGTCQNCLLNYEYSLAESVLVSACSPRTHLPW